jgi:hypothetical protein
MKNKLFASLAACSVLMASAVMAQDMPDIGFKSVGRGAPLLQKVNDGKEVGPGWIREPGSGFVQDASKLKLDGFRPGALPKNYKPLPRDIFNTPDFYADKALWLDPRYYRCGSPRSTEVQRGILVPPPLVLTNKAEDGVWGHCEIDYPRAAIVSPYGFKTAQAHYEALLAETKKRGGPNKYSWKDFPAAEWNGQYKSPFGLGGQGLAFSTEQQNWYWGAYSQTSTYASLLTPEYRQRFVQETYHDVHGHALWPSTFCWPEGFMRRWYWAAVHEHYVLVTPDVFQLTAGVARNFITRVHIGRQFNMEDVAKGGVPRLGAAVPRWYGESIGFWDKDTLITWTSNIQAWKSHTNFEFSHKMQSIEIYTPIRDKSGAFLGLNHEAILYDPEALVEPVRIVRNMLKVADYTDDKETPQDFIECIQTIYNVNGQNVSGSPGSKIELEIPDMYGRPWDKIWHDNFEKDMKRPDHSEELFNFK